MNTSDTIFVDHAEEQPLSTGCVAHFSNNNGGGAGLKPLLSKIIAVVACLLLYAGASAEKVFDFSLTCQRAYQQINSLKLDSGEQLVNQARKENPDNLIPEILDSYIDFYILFFNEDPKDYDRLMGHFSDRLDKLEEGPDNSPFYNFCRTTLYMQRACVEIKFGRQWSAGWDFRKAFALVKQNKKDFPSFVLNNVFYGPMLVAAGTIPDGYKWMAGLFGIKGSIKDGIAVIEQLVASQDSYARLFFNEVSFYYCYIIFYIQNDPDKVFRYVDQQKLDLVNNHLLAYMAANLAVNNKKNDLAASIIQKRNQSKDYLDISVWDFELAYTRLRRLQTNEAIYYFQQFNSEFKGKFYVKDALEKLSWCYYLQGNMKAAEATRKLVISKGNTQSDADKQADRAAKAGSWPNPLLLKARLLSDGGYSKEALELLNGKSAADFERPEDKLEFAYRVGRIYDDLGRNEEAVGMYLLAIRLGEGRTEYFAARSALQIAYIYEKEGKKDLAIRYFQQCINMKDHDYKDSLDQKAKAGIARCKGT
ncbi:MAG TPA: tetratricopeptide repeat protein [Panacibacter sp.]|nr:tetratricopeptide repeat protein [Panacibacter sp.]HNP44018.1 tetratricopeptide repeat protein [Panacibacter sp.]